MQTRIRQPFRKMQSNQSRISRNDQIWAMSRVEKASAAADVLSFPHDFLSEADNLRVARDGRSVQSPETVHPAFAEKHDRGESRRTRANPSPSLSNWM